MNTYPKDPSVIGHGKGATDDRADDDAGSEGDLVRALCDADLAVGQDGGRDDGDRVGEEESTTETEQAAVAHEVVAVCRWLREAAEQARHAKDEEADVEQELLAKNVAKFTGEGHKHRDNDEVREKDPDDGEDASVELDEQRREGDHERR